MINNSGWTLNDPPTWPPGIWHCTPSLAQFPQPSETIAFGDGRPNGSLQLLGCDAAGLHFGEEPPWFWSSTAQQSDFCGRHNGGVNLAFFDGHVKWMKVNEICRPTPRLLTMAED
jgi:prepilin-type processing-associated H-X9-DG protein